MNPTMWGRAHPNSGERATILGPAWLQFWRYHFPAGYKAALVVKNPPANAGRCQGRQLHPWVRKILWKRARQPTPVFLPGESHGQRSLVGYSPRGCKESDTTEAIQQATFGKTFDLCLSFPSVLRGANSIWLIEVGVRTNINPCKAFTTSRERHIHISYFYVSFTETEPLTLGL